MTVNDDEGDFEIESVTMGEEMRETIDAYLYYLYCMINVVALEGCIAAT